MSSPFLRLFLVLLAVCLAGAAPAPFAQTPPSSETPLSPSAYPSPTELVDPNPPAWVKTPLELPELDSTSATSASPTRLRIVEAQMDVRSESEFVHYAYRIQSEAGLQQAGQLSIDFAPGYQRLRWHYIRVWRDGRPRDALDPARIQILRQEENAERFLYHGKLSALVILHDLRVGDEIEYAYTRSGANPVFSGRFSRMLAGATTSPIDRLRYRVRPAAGRPLFVATIGDFTPSYELDGEDHVWSASDVRAIQPLGDVPSHEAQFPWLQISEYASWNEVRDWARPLFEQADQPSAELSERVRAITAGIGGAEEKANAILRFVQDDIRYLGLHLHESTHRPAAPGTVLERRFGDCKDKALLFVALLREIGLKADVALVNSTWNRGLATLQPSPVAFDHVIVRVLVPGKYDPPARPISTSSSSRPSSIGRFESQPLLESGSLGFGSYVWIDPTLSLQGGPLRDRHVPEYGFALLLAPGEKELVSVTAPLAARSFIRTDARYAVKDYTSPAELEVSQTYRGSAADAYRAYRRYADPERQTRDFAGFLERYHPNAQSLGTIRWDDDREANILVSRQSFSLPDLWTTDEKKEFRRLEVYPWSLAQRLPRPETAVRSASFALPHPTDWTQRCTITLPRIWPAQGESRSVSDPTFDFDYEARPQGRTIELSYRWRTNADSVPAGRMSEWTSKMGEVRGTFGYQLQQNIRLSEAVKRTGLVHPLLFAVILGLATGIALGVFFYFRPRRMLPPPLETEPTRAGIRGWLILIAVLVVSRPILFLIKTRLGLPMIENLPLWITITDPQSANYREWFAPITTIEFFASAAVFGWSLVIPFQFFRKKATFPRAYCMLLAAGLVWSLADLIAVRTLLPSTEPTNTAREVGRIIGFAIIPGLLIWYLLVSRRVRATFRR